MSFNYYDYSRFDLTIEDGKLICKDERLNSKDPIQAKYNSSEIAKLYLIKDNDFYQYIGTTFQPITKRLNQGMNANGSYGYHGYKWKTKSKIELFVWTFEGIDKIQIENIEAELVYFIREKYGKWIQSQNEIHFNNDFPFGRVLAKDIFEYLEFYHTEYNSKIDQKYSDITFKEPGQYGLRGDPYLWKEFKAIFEQNIIQNKEEFKKFLHENFEKIVGKPVSKSETYSVPRYRFGGMSSGAISCDFWLEKGFPLLIEQFEKANKNFR